MTGTPEWTLSALTELTAGDIMVTGAVSVAEHESLAAAWEVLARARFGILPVVRSGRVVGVIDDHAVVMARTTRWLDGRQRLVGEAARPAHAVPASTPVVDLIQQLRDDATRALVVVDAAGGPLGVVTPERLLAVVDSVLRPAHGGTAARSA